MSWKVDPAEEGAATWDARLRDSKATSDGRRAFQRWLGEDGANQAAYDRLQTALAVLKANADLPELSALRDEARDSVFTSRRRRFASLAAAAMIGVCALGGIALYRDDPGSEIATLLNRDKIYATSGDERTRVTLADGSIVTLDSATRIAVRLGATRRDVTLLSGRALFEVAKDRTRPFVVRAGTRTVTALGTVFDVRLSPREFRVTLAEGSVAVRPVDARGGSPEQILRPRQQLVVVAGAAPLELSSVDTDTALGWADQQIFFEDEPLASAVGKMNRYSAIKIVVDPDVADMRINGMFRVTNQASFIEALEATLPVDVRSGGDGRVLVSRRSDRPEM